MYLFRFLYLGFVQAILLLGLGITDDDAVPDSATTVKFDFARQCKIDGQAFFLEKSTLADVIRAAGAGVIHDNGKDAGGHEFFVSYFDGHNVIRFSSNAEMNSDAHEIGDIELRPPGANEKVAALPPFRLPIAFQFGSLGMSFSDLVAALGPAVKKHGVAWYQFESKKSIKDSSGKMRDDDVFGTLRVEITMGKVTAIQLGHVTSF